MTETSADANRQPHQKNPQLGYASAVCAQLIWGLFPIYLRYLESVPAANVVAHRAIWSFVLLAGLMTLARLVTTPLLPTFREFLHTFQSRHALVACGIAALFIAINWIVFVWSATSDHLVDASLGYYICPQVMVVLGVVFLGERLGKWQWVAVVIVTAGVLYMALSKASLIWISLVIAVSFGLYALCKKKTRMSALGGLAVETALLLIPALVFLAYQSQTGTPVFPDSILETGLLLGTGLATIAPLALYALALKHIPMSTVGFLQFIGPTIQFGVGVFLFHEGFDQTRFWGFTVVWIGVFLFLFSKRLANQKVNEQVGEQVNRPPK